MSVVTHLGKTFKPHFKFFESAFKIIWPTRSDVNHFCKVGLFCCGFFVNVPRWEIFQRGFFCPFGPPSLRSFVWGWLHPGVEVGWGPPSEISWLHIILLKTSRTLRFSPGKNSAGWYLHPLEKIFYLDTTQHGTYWNNQTFFFKKNTYNHKEYNILRNVFPWTTPVHCELAFFVW